MYDLFTNKGSNVDRSPLQFAKFTWLKGRILENYEKLLELRRVSQGRLDSNHLLIRILSNITVRFNGDLMEYISAVDSQVRRITAPLGITTSVSRGRITQNVFYNGCDEIITASRIDLTPMDLWSDWRAVSPITVCTHPYTTLTLFDPAVMDSPTSSSDEPGLAVINIDIPMMAAQYVMYKSSYPKGTMEKYITQVLLPAMMKSHIDVVLFNKVLLELGVIPARTVRSNLPFAQIELETASIALSKEVVAGMLSVAMTATQLVNTIPVVFSESMSEAVNHPPLMSQQQALWALHTQSVDKARLVLEVARRRSHYDRLLQLIVRIRRDNIQLTQEGWYRNGQSRYNQELLMHRWMGVLDLLPEEVTDQ